MRIQTLVLRYVFLSSRVVSSGPNLISFERKLIKFRDGEKEKRKSAHGEYEKLRHQYFLVPSPTPVGRDN